MAPRQQDLEIPVGGVPVQAVDDPILSSPYEEPAEHWKYRDGIPSRHPGRRPASYWFTTQRTGSAQIDLLAEESFDDLPLINALREDVKRWRESGYRGAAAVTKDLLRWWSREDAPRRLFFCQREPGGFVQSVAILAQVTTAADRGWLGSTRQLEFSHSATQKRPVLTDTAPV